MRLRQVRTGRNTRLGGDGRRIWVCSGKKSLLGLDVMLTIHHQALLENAPCSPRLGGKWVAPEEWTSICPLKATLSSVKRIYTGLVPHLRTIARKFGVVPRIQ
jgi:hypothetical protein